jgi:uncharacterized protein YjbI with pentapeptide repeats
MFLQNLSDTSIISGLFNGQTFSDSQIQNCVFDGAQIHSTVWNDISMRDTNANDMQFSRAHFASSNISRSSLMNTSFSDCRFETLAFSGVTLIKTRWLHVRSNRSSITQCTLQRCVIKDSMYVDSLFSDFEGINASVENCFFQTTRFEITYGGGMNGFSGAELKNCIFCGCTFTGFPLRGAIFENCTFINCRGEITDDCEGANVYGLPRFCAPPVKTALTQREQAEELISIYRTTKK